MIPAKLTNAQIILRVRRFQEHPNLHPLTCKSCSEILEAVEKADKVILRCSKCSYIQADIPEVLFKISDDFLESSTKAYLKKVLKRDYYGQH